MSTIVKTILIDAVLVVSCFDSKSALLLFVHHCEPLVFADSCNKLIHDNTFLELGVFKVT